VKNQDILNDDALHFKLARSVLKIASFEFANLKYFNSTFMNLKNARLVLNAKCEIQSNLDYPDLDYPDYSIIRTFFSGPNFFMNIN